MQGPPLRLPERRLFRYCHACTTTSITRTASRNTSCTRFVCGKFRWQVLVSSEADERDVARVCHRPLMQVTTGAVTATQVSSPAQGAERAILRKAGWRTRTIQMDTTRRRWRMSSRGWITQSCNRAVLRGRWDGKQMNGISCGMRTSNCASSGCAMLPAVRHGCQFLGLR